MSKERQMIYDRITLPIGLPVDYKADITIEDISHIKGVRSTDVVRDITYQENPKFSFGITDTDGDEFTYTPIIIVERRRLETDKEVIERLKSKHAEERGQYELEKLEYFRLKVKFENEI